MVFAFTKIRHASLITSHAKVATAGGIPLPSQLDEVAIAAAVTVFDDVVEILGLVVEIFGVVDGVAGVVLGTRGV